MNGLVDYGAIADAAVDDMFGFDELDEFDDDEEFGRVGPRRRAFRAGKRAARRRVGRRRERQRAALGSPAWQAGLVPGQGYSASELLAPDFDDGLGSDLLDAELDAILAEDEEEAEGDYYGFDSDDEYGDDEDDDEVYLDEFGRLRRGRRGGRRGGRPRARRRAFRRGKQKAQRKMKRRRRRRRQHAPQPTFRQPMMLPQWQGEEEEEEEEFFPPVPDSYTPSGIAEFYEENYGSVPPAVAPPPSHAPSFGESVVMGAGVGLGFMVAAFGVSALARGLGAK